MKTTRWRPLHCLHAERGCDPIPCDCGCDECSEIREDRARSEGDDIEYREAEERRGVPK